MAVGGNLDGNFGGNLGGNSVGNSVGNPVGNSELENYVISNVLENNCKFRYFFKEEKTECH